MAHRSSGPRSTNGAGERRTIVGHSGEPGPRPRVRVERKELKCRGTRDGRVTDQGRGREGEKVRRWYCGWNRFPILLRVRINSIDGSREVEAGVVSGFICCGIAAELFAWFSVDSRCFHSFDRYFLSQAVYRLPSLGPWNARFGAMRSSQQRMRTVN